MDNGVHAPLPRKLLCLLAVSTTDGNLPSACREKPMPLVKMENSQSSEESQRLLFHASSRGDGNGKGQSGGGTSKEGKSLQSSSNICSSIKLSLLLPTQSFGAGTCGAGVKSEAWHGA
jgi:hypothetical protein